MSKVTVIQGTTRIVTIAGLQGTTKVVTVRDSKATITISENGRQGAPGPAGPSGAGSLFLKVQFTYTDGPSIIVLSVTDGDTIVDSEVVIETAFDDVAATISLGSVADSSLILSTTENLPSALGNYGNQNNFKFALNEQIRIYINPGTSTQGSGHVLISKI